MTKINTETTKFDRLRVIIGAILAFAGGVTILGLGAIYGYERTTIWVAGFLLIISGVFIARSVELANAISEWLR